jgi:hypothetical protein
LICFALLGFRCSAAFVLAFWCHGVVVALDPVLSGKARAEEFARGSSLWGHHRRLRGWLFGNAHTAERSACAACATLWRSGGNTLSPGGRRGLRVEVHFDGSAIEIARGKRINGRLTRRLEEPVQLVLEPRHAVLLPTGAIVGEGARAFTDMALTGGVDATI